MTALDWINNFCQFFFFTLFFYTFDEFTMLSPTLILLQNSDSYGDNFFKSAWKVVLFIDWSNLRSPVYYGLFILPLNTSLALTALSFPRHTFKFRSIIFLVANSAIWKISAVSCHNNAETKWLVYSEVLILNYQNHLSQVQTQDW